MQEENNNNNRGNIPNNEENARDEVPHDDQHQPQDHPGQGGEDGDDRLNRGEQILRQIFDRLINREDDNEDDEEEQPTSSDEEGEEDDDDVRNLLVQNNILLPYFRMDEDNIVTEGGVNDGDGGDEDESGGGGVNNNNHDNNNNGGNRNQNNVNFDMTLPTRHNYLGEIEFVEDNLKSKLLEGGSIQKDLPVLALKNVVLLPGEIIPLKIFDRSERMMFLDIISQIPFKHFGILHIDDKNNFCKMGTTVQINSIKVTGSLISILAVGIQRFEVLSSSVNERSSMVYVEARIVEDREASYNVLLRNISPVSPLKCSPKTLNKIFQYNSSHFPLQILADHDCTRLMKKARELITNNLHYHNKDVELLDEVSVNNNNNNNNNGTLEQTDFSQYCFRSTNPTHFSFWATKMLPIDLLTKQVFLEIPSTYFRLVEIIRILQKYNNIYCRKCAALLSNKEHIFSMCVDGPSSSFVNPHGYVHQLCTLRRVTGVYLVGFPSARDSWFPSYKWTIVNCVNCHSHLGWKFTTEIRNMEPKFFYGLSRANITTDPNNVLPNNNNNNNENENEEMSDEN